MIQIRTVSLVSGDNLTQEGFHLLSDFTGLAEDGTPRLRAWRLTAPPGLIFL